MTDKIVVEGLYKIFGTDPNGVLDLMSEDTGKDDLFARTGHTVGVQDASFSIRAGEIFVVMGLSGSGKSTLVRMLNRLIEPTAGRVLIDGQEIVQMSPRALIELRRRDIAMVFQSFALLPHLTVLENAAFGLEVADMARAERQARAAQALEQVGLRANADSYPDQLSGGMQQRVGLARALATDPSILLMDEAFSALDPLIRREMQEELLRLQDQHERTVVFISHDLDEAMRIGDRIAIMEAGRVLQVGTPREILDNPATEYVRAFFRDVDVTQVYTAGDLAEPPPALFRTGASLGVADLRQRLAEGNYSYGYLQDEAGRFRGVTSLESLESAKSQSPESALLPDPRLLRAGTRLNDAIGRVAGTPYPVPVVDRRGVLLGVLSRTGLLLALEKSQ